MALEFVKPDDKVPVNVLLYGPAKTGKSVGAASVPGKVLYLNADTPNATRFAHAKYGERINEVKVEGLQTLIDAATALQAGEFDACVLDPVGDVYRRVIEDMSNRALSPQIQQYGDTGTHVERFCRLLCDLPIYSVIVAHETSTKDEATGSFERLPWTGTNNPALGAKLMAMVDIIGYTGIVIEGQGDESREKFVAQLINDKGRRGGDRFGVLGHVREVDIAEWIDLAKESITNRPADEPVKEAV